MSRLFKLARPCGFLFALMAQLLDLLGTVYVDLAIAVLEVEGIGKNCPEKCGALVIAGSRAIVQFGQKFRGKAVFVFGARYCPEIIQNNACGN